MIAAVLCGDRILREGIRESGGRRFLTNRRRWDCRLPISLWTRITGLFTGL